MNRRVMHALHAALAVLCAALAVSYAVCALYRANVIPHRKYTSGHFGIDTYVSTVDRDADGVDDQSDILQSARAYIATKPRYESKYYASGYPDDGCGVCTDVVAFALLGAGYDLMNDVARHIESNRELYDIDRSDKNIDFRRVRNLAIYFEHTASPRSTDVTQLDEWQGGDIVIFSSHIGIVSDKRNRNGVPFVIHHANAYQIRYEEDILEKSEDIIGHYRIS